jgi:3-hydroxyisobutyrate dehydrogenase-like beta-hydroxyacid dehydrogenase
MSGGPARARDGSMSLMVACATRLRAPTRALLETLSRQAVPRRHAAGDGARTKLVNNLLAGINLAGAAEAMALAERLGLDPARTLDVIEQSSGQSWIGSDRMQPRHRRRLRAAGPRHAAAEGHPAGAAGRAAAGFEGRLGARPTRRSPACEAGLAGRDDAALLQLLRQAGTGPAG